MIQLNWKTLLSIFVLTVLYSFVLSSVVRYEASRVPQFGTPPDPRSLYAFTSLDQNLYVYGGEGFTDLWRFVTAGSSDPFWERLQYLDTEAPPVSSGAGAFTAPGSFFIFGGLIQDETLNDELWQYSIEEQFWSKIHPNGTSPSGRYAMTFMSGENGKYYMLGGESLDDLFEEIWEYDINKNQWTLLTQYKSYPLNRFQCAQYYKGSIIIVEVQSLIKRESISIFDLSTSQWRYIAASNQPFEVHQNCAIHGHHLYVVPLVKRIDLDQLLQNPVPNNLSWEIMIEYDLELEKSLLGDFFGFQTITVGNSIYYFGGFRNDTYSNELDRYNVNSKVIEVVTNNIPFTPPPLSAHTAVQIESRMLVYGGKNSKGVATGDIYAFDVHVGEWNKLQIQGLRPPGRFGHIAASHSHMMYIQGGFSADDVPLADFWVFDSVKLMWTNVTGTISDFIFGTPGPRGYHSSTSNETHWFIYGGKGPDLETLTELWSFNFLTLEWRMLYSTQHFDINAPDLGILCAITHFNGDKVLVGACSNQNLQDQNGTFVGSEFWIFDICNSTWSPPIFAPDTTLGLDGVVLNYGQSTLFNLNSSLLLYSANNNTLVNVCVEENDTKLAANLPSTNNYARNSKALYSATYFDGVVTVFGNEPPSNEVWQFTLSFSD